MIVDGTASGAMIEVRPMLVVAPTRAVLHRRGGCVEPDRLLVYVGLHPDLAGLSDAPVTGRTR